MNIIGCQCEKCVIYTCENVLILPPGSGVCKLGPNQGAASLSLPSHRILRRRDLVLGSQRLSSRGRPPPGAGADDSIFSCSPQRAARSNESRKQSRRAGAGKRRGSVECLHLRIMLKQHTHMHRKLVKDMVKIDSLLLVARLKLILSLRREEIYQHFN